MPLVQITPFRQFARAYSALLGIQESLRGLHDASQTVASASSTNEHLEAEVANLRAKLAELEGSINERIGKAIRDHLLLPLASKSADRPFMPFSTCSVSDFLHPRYDELCRVINHPRQFHRKLWEWVFILHHLEQAGALKEGSRGLGFGVGLERLPSVFAARGVTVVATDAPPEIGASWNGSGEHSDTLAQLRYPDLVAEDVFASKVSHRYEDMTTISADLTGFDFTWSACCFEHLGSLDAGMEFVFNSLGTLRPGGIAVHTTEFNLSSNDRTIDSGPTVLYRRQDMEMLVERLTKDGHQVNPFIIAPDSHYLDGYVDLPPYSHEPSLKIKLEEFVTTSVGIVVRKRQ
ncbi:hypothetical protein AB4Y38_09435 [Paraburkholderia sp. EG285A]|uniref:hypothetical protein n=1 Tax=Paraburkholderia sp. EG285A TaxID=3237009 RepID=UPI0034D370B7